MTSLLESLIIQKQKTEIDISEEYFAWASKVKNRLRLREEDSSIAVNASTVQKFGFMLEKNLKYQGSWFDQGMPCELQKDKKLIDPVCYSHTGPIAEDKRKIINGSKFIFKAVASGSADVIYTMAHLKSPITASIRAHPMTWKISSETGHLVLTEEHKKECISKVAKCSAHAVLIVGYDLDKKVFHFKNSWGAKWGDKGYGTIPFNYMDQMSVRKFMTGTLTKKLKLG